MGVRGFCVHAATLRGIEAIPVTVEASAAGGIPGITIVGMPDSAVLEARARVRCAMRACGYEIPRLHITINLAPADIRKVGTGFDLPIAVAILACTRQIPTEGLDGCLFAAELGLYGEVNPTRGSMAYLLLAKDMGLDFVTSAESSDDLYGCGRQKAISSISQLRDGVARLNCEGNRERISSERGDSGTPSTDFSDVIGQEVAKRALVVCATGEHGLLMQGPPGAGKSMLARRLPQILPPMSEEEASEAMLVHSVAGLPLEPIAKGERPFRSPHHSISAAGLVGGGRPVLPGEVSLAHRGVLFLDELPEFAINTLQSLRQPMEDGEVRIVRTEGSFVFPCDFLFVAAANPCPCGYLGDPVRPCNCSQSAIERYQGRIGGPLLDRIELHVDVARPDQKALIEGETGLSSAEMAEKVMRGREFASWRNERYGKELSSASLASQMDEEARRVFERLSSRLALGGRAMKGVSRVARTIADISERELISADDVMDACAFRRRG